MYYNAYYQFHVPQNKRIGWMRNMGQEIPHQAFLTKEALQEIANLTIKNLDNWHEGKCSGKACICIDGCKKNLAVI